MKTKSILLATASSLALVCAVSTAGPLMAAPKAAPTFSWTGFYVGGNVGFARHHWEITDLGGDPPFTASRFAFARGTTFWDSSDTGLTFGGQAGYNWQHDRLIFGVEADFNYLGTHATGSFAPAFGAGSVNAEANAKWFATARGRLGVTLSPTFVYVTGGLAAVKIREAWGRNTLAPINAQFVDDKTKFGPVAGIGVEHALTDRWSVKAELLKVWLSHDTASHRLNAITYRSEFHNGLLIGRVGLNFRL
jgi:outer membrane immunogenic protein